MPIRVKNWSKFQHFKDRRPPWIKLYRDLLDDLEWHELDADAAKALVSIWLIASEEDGELPDMKRLAFRLRMTIQKLEQVVSKLGHWLEQDDIKVISERYQHDPLERETEKEKEKEEEEESETEKTPRAVRSPTLPKPDDVQDQVWSDWCALRKAKKATVTATVLSEARQEASKAGLTLERFLSIWCARGSQGLQADWLKPHERGSPSMPINRQEAQEARNRAVAEEWLREQGVSDAASGQGEILSADH